MYFNIPVQQEGLNKAFLGEELYGDVPTSSYSESKHALLVDHGEPEIVCLPHTHQQQTWRRYDHCEWSSPL